MRTRSFAGFPAAGVLAVIVLFAGCDHDPAIFEPAVSGTFVGRVEGTDTLIAVVTNGIAVRVYVCDGTPERELTISEWFRGTQSQNTIDIRSLDGDTRVVAEVAEEAVTGLLELPDRPAVLFTAIPATGPAGFYLYKGDHGGQLHWTGWIVLPDGERRGSMVQPTRTSLGVTLNLPTSTAQLPGAGTVIPGRLVPSNVVSGFGGNQWP